MKRPCLRPAVFFLLILTAVSAPAFEVGMPSLSGVDILERADRENLEEAVRNELRAVFPSSEWTLMPADLLGLALESEGLDPATCAAEECFSEMGRKLNLDILVLGYFRRTSAEDRVLLKLYDMETGKMEGFIRVTGSDPRALHNSLPEACGRLLHPYRLWKPETETSVNDDEAELLAEAWTEQNEDTVETLVPASTPNEIGGSDSAASAESRSILSGWSLGMNAGTYSGPNHAVLMNHLNNIMVVMGPTTTPFQSFEVGTPLGGRIMRSFRGPISFAGTYHFSQFTQKGLFVPHGWESERNLTSNLHEFILGFHYALSFVKSSTVEPYVGAGAAFLFADSQLDIGLDNPGTDDVDKTFLIESTDFALGAEAYIGLNYHLSSKLMLQGELGGTMGQVSQSFDYAGSLQHLEPGTPQDAVEDPSVNDILWGSYPLDLNGLRLSIGLLFTL